MLSFEVLNETNAKELKEKLNLKISDGDLPEIIDSFLEFSHDGAEVALAAESDLLLVRIYDDGRYSFVYPIAFSDTADRRAALIMLTEYARRELIPIYLTDVPREELSLITATFPHVEARAYDDDEDGFVVCINSECDMLDGVPEISGEGLSLSEISGGDAEEYKRLVLDKNLNRYFGYDVTLDMPNPTGEELIELTRREYHRGVALSLAIMREGKFIGEAVIYDYDYMGSAEFAIRLLPEYHGMGLGRAALCLLIALARGMKLKTLRARVAEENLPSLKMTEAYLERVKSDDGLVYFELSL